ncbi:MAG: DUF465 domain-containing protein [Phyllobacteriaceae bacterium]|nr:DUF465 domain-containing protein [Phyllobacteriaceae bacterium]
MPWFDGRRADIAFLCLVQALQSVIKPPHPFHIDSAMSDEDNINLRMKLAALELEHADLGKAVDALARTGGDLLCIQRLKKKKLVLKDEISRLRVRVMPDIIA